MTAPDMTPGASIDLHSHHCDVEHDFRDIKVTMSTERILAHSRDVFVKELFTPLAAYNLVAQIRRKGSTTPAEFHGCTEHILKDISKANTIATARRMSWPLQASNPIGIAGTDPTRPRPQRLQKNTPRRHKTTMRTKNNDRKENSTAMTKLRPLGDNPDCSAHR